MYSFSQAARALRQHLTSTFATLTTSLVSFTLLFLLGLVLWNLNRVVQTLENDLNVYAFIKPGADSEKLLAEIQAWSDITKTKLISREEALADLQLSYPALSKATELIDNPLPDTLKLTLADPSLVRQVARRLEKMDSIGDGNVEYGGAITEQMVKVLGGVRLAVNLLIVLLLFDTLFSIMGTIRLSIENRREELRVMQLVGATRRFIQGPFMVEGLLLTLSAAVLALGLGWLAYHFLATALQQLLPFVPVLGTPDIARAALAMLLLSIALGVGGAYLASRANLRETDL